MPEVQAVSGGQSARSALRPATWCRILKLRAAYCGCLSAPGHMAQSVGEQSKVQWGAVWSWRLQGIKTCAAAG